MSTDAPELPAVTWLGCPIDLTSVSPMDMKIVLSGVNKAHRISDLMARVAKSTNIDGNTYSVPDSMDVSSLPGSLSPSYVCYETYTKARAVLKKDVNLQTLHLAVSGADLMSYCIDKLFTPSVQYALYSMSADSYRAEFDAADMARHLDEDMLMRMVEGLPTTFSPEKVSSFQAFFNSVGSHVITAATYGARYSLNSSLFDMNKFLINREFSHDVCALFNGIPSGGKFNPDIKNEYQYKTTFLNNSMNTVICVGGDPVLSATAMEHPYDYECYDAWTRTMSAEGHANLIRLTVTELWALMRNADRVELRAHADALQAAFEWIMLHPPVCRTRATFNVMSDCGTLQFYG